MSPDNSIPEPCVGAREPLGRRTFAKRVVGALVAPIAVGAHALQPSQTPANELGERPEDLSAAEWDEVGARFANLLRVYGTRLDPAQRRVLANVLIGNERMLSSIRRFATQNSDPAALTLRLVP